MSCTVNTTLLFPYGYCREQLRVTYARDVFSSNSRLLHFDSHSFTQITYEIVTRCCARQVITDRMFTCCVLKMSLSLHLSEINKCCLLQIFYNYFTSIRDKVIIFCMVEVTLPMFYRDHRSNDFILCARDHFTMITDVMTTYCACYRCYHYFAAITDRIATCFVCQK